VEIKAPRPASVSQNVPISCPYDFPKEKCHLFSGFQTAKRQVEIFVLIVRNEEMKKKKERKKLSQVSSSLLSFTFSPSCRCVHSNIWACVETQLPNIDMLLKNGASWLSSVRKMLPKSRTRVYVSIIPVIQSASTARPRLPLQPRSSDLTLLRLLHPLPWRNHLCLSLRWKKLVLKPQGKSR